VAPPQTSAPKMMLMKRSDTKSKEQIQLDPTLYPLPLRRTAQQYRYQTEHCSYGIVAPSTARCCHVVSSSTLLPSFLANLVSSFPPCCIEHAYQRGSAPWFRLPYRLDNFIMAHIPTPVVHRPPHKIPHKPSKNQAQSVLREQKSHHPQRIPTQA